MHPIFHGPAHKPGWLKTPFKAPKVDRGSEDSLSQKALQLVRDSLNVEPEWSIQHRHGFTWWPGRFEQHVWVETAPDPRSSWPRRLCLEVEVLREVDWTTPALAEVSSANETAALGGLVADLKNRRLCCRSTVYFCAETLPAKAPIIRLVAGLQPGRAQQLVELGGEKHFGGRLHVSPHPSLGPRKSGHAVLHRASRLKHLAGEVPSAFGLSDFEGLKTMSPEPWILATAKPSGFTAEFPFSGWKPFQGGRPQDGASLLEIGSDEPHPELGSGAGLRLTLPAQFNTDQCWKRSAQLNFQESHEWTGFDSVGAWYGDPPSGYVSWRTFLPSAARPLEVLRTLVWGVAARARWARTALSGEAAAR